MSAPTTTSAIVNTGAPANSFVLSVILLEN